MASFWRLTVAFTVMVRTAARALPFAKAQVFDGLVPVAAVRARLRRREVRIRDKDVLTVPL